MLEAVKPFDGLTDLGAEYRLREVWSGARERRRAMRSRYVSVCARSCVRNSWRSSAKPSQPTAFANLTSAEGCTPICSASCAAVPSAKSSGASSAKRAIRCNCRGRSGNCAVIRVASFS
jgi:hypothetical protein